MKTTIGGDRLGSGNKQEVSLKNYNRSTHDLSGLWRSSMAAGTLVPFMSEVALPGDSWDIDLNCEVITLPTIGPLFGSYKVQLDVFQIPMRLYNAGLHGNRLNVGLKMSDAKLPQVNIPTRNLGADATYESNEQINSSALLKYLGIGGLGSIEGTANPVYRQFNAVPLLAYWDIYKNYYANRQEEDAYVIHTGLVTSLNVSAALIEIIAPDTDQLNCFNVNVTVNRQDQLRMQISIPTTGVIPDPQAVYITIDGSQFEYITDAFNSVIWNANSQEFICTQWALGGTGNMTIQVETQGVQEEGGVGSQIALTKFPLSSIDTMRDNILSHRYEDGVFVIDENSDSPYSLAMQDVEEDYAIIYSQEGLGIKTYQSDLFNNWISTEWIDGANGINEVTSISTEGDSFTVDALNLASKVYEMLNRIAVSGGSYDDWLDATYMHERSKGVYSPVYQGSLIKELAFEEVISTAEAGGSDEQPLGTLAGRGRLTGKNKGGKIKIKVDEPSYIMGIVSLTPRIGYSQGNKWDVNLKTFDDMHKPALDAIGYQDLVTEQMMWSDTIIDTDVDRIIKHSAGKQPAWINYMTEVDRVYGNFAEEAKDMFMVLNRRYENDANGRIKDLTTYIDPTKYNQIFAQTAIDSQNFWVQISKKITARRKMSAKVIPNL